MFDRRSTAGAGHLAELYMQKFSFGHRLDRTHWRLAIDFTFSDISSYTIIIFRFRALELDTLALDDGLSWIGPVLMRGRGRFYSQRRTDVYELWRLDD